MVIKFAKVNMEGKIPQKRDEDAGYDLFPAFKEDFILIYPNETKLIPLGIASYFPKDYCMIIKERSSTGMLGIGQRSGVIDSGYRGEWKAPITNHSNFPIAIVKDEYLNSVEFKELLNEENLIVYSYNKAIAQAILISVPVSTVIEVSYDDLCEIKSERMDSGFGSTNQ